MGNSYILTRRIDHATPNVLVSSSHEARVGRLSCNDHDGVLTIGHVLVSQLTHQLRLLGIVAVTQQRVDVGAVRIRVGRRCQECSFQVDVDLTEDRMKPVIHRTHGIASIEVGSIGSRHLRLNVQHRACARDPGNHLRMRESRSL